MVPDVLKRNVLNLKIVHLSLIANFIVSNLMLLNMAFALILVMHVKDFVSMKFVGKKLVKMILIAHCYIDVTKVPVYLRIPI